MPRPVIGPLSQMALGFILCFATVGVAACASLPDPLPCQLEAMQKVLGKNRNHDQKVTPADAEDISARLKACAATDGGK